MATSSYFSTSNQYVKYWIIVDQQSQSITGNTSSVRVRVQFWRTNSGYQTWGSGTVWCKIDGQWYSASVTPDQKIGSTITLFDKTVTVGHNTDGTKSLYVSAYINHNAPLNSSEQGFTTQLTTIPRKSTASIPTFTFGSSGTISINRAASSFTHTVKYKCGTKSGTIGTGVGTSVSWTPPASYMSETPNSTRLVGSITVVTYSGGTYIGENTYTAYFDVPSNIVPSISSFSASAVSDIVPSNWGMYVQGKSKCKLTIGGASGTNGSTIKSYSIRENGGNAIGSSTSVTTDTITKSGTTTYVATVTDSRGRSASKTVSISVQAYSEPQFTKVTTQRATSGGTPADEGTYARCTASTSYSSLGGKNGVTLKVAYRQTGGAWSGDTTFSSAVTIGGGRISTNYTYDIRYTLSDKLGGSATYMDFLSTAYVLMDFKKGGKGLAVGKVAEKDGYMEVDLKADFNKGLSLPIEGGMKDLAGWLTSTKSALNGGISSLRTDWQNGQKSDLDKLNQILSTLSGIGQVCEAGAWGSEWTLDGEYRTLGNKRNVDNKWFKTDSYYSAITAKTGGLHLLTVSSTFFPTGNTQVDFLVSKNGSAVDYSTHSMVGRTYFARTAWAISLNAMDKVDIKVRCYGTVKCNGWDVIRLVKLS